MKLTVLVDNNVYIDHYYYGEPALSLYLEDGASRVLFDTGYSGLFIQNAELMGIELSTLTKLALSHGHNDHTGGLNRLPEIADSDLQIIAHPASFYVKKEDQLMIGSPVSLSDLKQQLQVQLSREPIKLSEHITFLGEIPQRVDFEPRKQVGDTLHQEKYVPDYVLDDTALAFEGEQGLYIITGCSHSGICNICEYAKEVTGNQRILGVLGGFHLFDEDEQLTKTIDYFEKNQITDLAPCHCVSFSAKAKIHQRIPIKEVGVGMTGNGIKKKQNGIMDNL